MTIGEERIAKTGQLRPFLAEWVRPFLRERGFTQRGQAFRAQRGDNAIVIRFQTRGAYFTCDIAVASTFLARTATEWEPPEHLTYRLGPLVARYDKWWDLEGEHAQVAQDFLATLSIGLDFIAPLTTDEGLRDAFLRTAHEDSRGIAPLHATQLQRLVATYGLPAGADQQVRVRDGSTLDVSTTPPTRDIQ